MDMGSRVWKRIKNCIHIPDSALKERILRIQLKNRFKEQDHDNSYLNIYETSVYRVLKPILEKLYFH